MTQGDVHPTDAAPIIRWRDGGAEVVQLRWGFEPQTGTEAVINVRAEGADLKDKRCLIPATEFELFTGAQSPKRRWRITVIGEDTFFFAGIWREKSASWPESFAALTIDAAPDLERLTDRQLAVIRASEAPSWLADKDRAVELLKALPRGSYQVQCME